MTKEELQALVHSKLKDYPFIVVSNREPYIHSWVGEEIRCFRPASGLTVALDPVMQACGGTWVAHGSGDADPDVVDEEGKILVPTEAPRYTLKRVWLSKEEEEGYYDGFSNQALWPLCHIVYVKPIFRQKDWDAYKEVNRRFADAVYAELAEKGAFVFIQDYHLALLARMIKEDFPTAVTAQFWHIPWPNYEAFRICPWKEEILEGLLANDLIGFHTLYHCNNFLETVDRTLECRIERERYAIVRGGHTTLVRPFPISVDFSEISARASKEEVTKEMERLRHEYNLRQEFIGIGIDRLDYTKGIPERLKAVELFLNKNPQYEGRFTFVQVGEPSRIHVEEYKKINEEIDELVEEINWRHWRGRWRPILYIKEHLSPVTLIALRRLANFCIVSSLHDGMNLVAKEFVSSRVDGGGVLILSHFTGAARELTDALLVNPYSVDDIAHGIDVAVRMPEQEWRKRMSSLRAIVQENDVYSWAGNIISEIARIQFPGG
ncbi:MAG: alpha,alpha-trehalose-phosphate synthase (UDP-forming) [Dehalococcoidia bacterium]